MDFLDLLAELCIVTSIANAIHWHFCDDEKWFYVPSAGKLLWIYWGWIVAVIALSIGQLKVFPRTTWMMMILPSVGVAGVVTLQVYAIWFRHRRRSRKRD